LVIGVGNEYRSDDGIGLLVARRVREQRSDVACIEASGEGASLMAQWRALDHVVLIDAVRSGSRPGRVHRLDARNQSIPSDFFHYSTHAFGVAEAVEMARTLGTLPEQLIVFGIEGKKFDAGRAPSPEVDAVVDDVMNRVLAELDSFQKNPQISDARCLRA
jgi:hydrogenase maturation protease